MTDKMQLVVATPCFGGQVSSIYASSIFALQRAVHGMSNLGLKVHLRDGDALITRARANLVAMFLDDPAATHLLFIDADIGFKPEQVFRLIESGADVVAGVYPIKRVNWDKAKRAIGAAGRRAGGVARLRARDRGSRPRRGGQRLYPGALCRNRLPDDPAPGAGEDVRASGLRPAAILPRAFASTRWPAARTVSRCSNA